MTKKELQTHDWKVGETVYVLGMREYQAFSIPVKVIKAKVTKVEGYWFCLKTCNKKDDNLLPCRRFCTDRYPRFLQRNERLFLKKDDADLSFEYCWKDFLEKRKDAFYSHLLTRLNDLDRQKNEICGIMRMKAMKKDNGQGSNS